jgi:hypothetical protein
MEDGTLRSALDLVLSAWCDVSETVSGSWNIRVRYDYWEICSSTQPVDIIATLGWLNYSAILILGYSKLL